MLNLIGLKNAKKVTVGLEQATIIVMTQAILDTQGFNSCD